MDKVIIAVFPLLFTSALSSSCLDNECLVCAQPAVCTQCLDGFFVFENGCMSCIDHCLECDNEESCIQCEQTYTVVDGQCISCTIDNCKSIICNDGVICTQCADGYILNQDNLCDTCAEHIDDCIMCESQTKTCTQCREQFYLESDGSCAQCESQSTCAQACLPLYYSTNNNECKVCGEGISQCIECEQSSPCEGCLEITCTKCSENHFVNAQATCTQCYTLPDCVQQTCLTSSLICTRCVMGAYLEDGECFSCSEALQGCLTCNSKAMCQTCASQYIRGESEGSIKCIHCGSFGDDYCIQCSFPFECSACRPYYALYSSNQQTKCQPCDMFIQHCYDCSDVTVCERCWDGFVLTDEGSCQFCPPTTTANQQQTACLTCEDITAFCVQCTYDECEGCAIGYFLEEGQCSPCVEYCALCFTLHICEQCRIGYALMNGYCVESSLMVRGVMERGPAVQECGGGCLDCMGSVGCHRCAQGYTLIFGFCTYCLAPCKSCYNSIDSCQSCYPTYYLMGTVCLKCPSNCLYCFLSDCFQCLQGYSLVERSCVQCPIGCIHCTHFFTCVQCQPGYTLLDGYCIKCHLQCTQCAVDEGVKCLTTMSQCPYHCIACDQQQCLQCMDGYRIVKGQCVEVCEFPCLTCVEGKPTKCLSCYLGYTFEAQQSKCIEEISCNVENECQFCPRGYYLSEQKCTKCAEEACIYCTDTMCTQCDDSHYISNGQCIQCPEECQRCTAGGQCWICKTGYYMLKDIAGFPIGKCNPCSQFHFCKSCESSPISCTSCIDGFELIGHSCLSISRILFRIVLDKDFADFGYKLATFRSLLIGMIDDSVWYPPNDFINIVKVERGSTKVTGYITVPPTYDIYSLLKRYSQNVEEVFAGMFIRVLESEFISFSSEDPPEQEEEESTLPVYAIVLISVGPVVIISVIIGCVLYHRNKNKESVTKSESPFPSTNVVMIPENSPGENPYIKEPSEQNPITG